MTGETYKRDDIPALYQQGYSLNKVAELTGISYPTVRRDLIAAGVPILSRKEAVARHPGGWNRHRVGEKRPPMAAETRQKMSVSARARWDAAGVVGHYTDHQGYLRFTCGSNAGRHVHVVVMEERIGRRLRPDENVHHIDDDKLNNDENNLALVTKSGHGRLHRHQDRISGNQRPRGDHGQFVSSKSTEI